MTLIEIEDRVETIDRIKGDYEMAHAMEDRLMRDFVEFVAQSGDDHMATLARAVLKTEELDFPRYCA